MQKNELSATKAKGYVVQFFPQKRTALVHTRVQLRSSNSFFQGSYLDGSWQAMPSITTFLSLKGMKIG